MGLWARTISKPAIGRKARRRWRPPRSARGVRAVLGGSAKIYAQEYSCHSPEEKRWFVGRVTRFACDGPPRLAVAHENITERKRMEEALRLSEAAFTQAQQLARVGHWDRDLRAQWVAWSPETYRIFGYSPRAGPVPASFFLQHVHPEDNVRVARALADAQEGSQPYDLRFRIVRPDGTVRFRA